MSERDYEAAHIGRSERLSLREHNDWLALARRRGRGRETPGGTRFEIERVDRHGIVGYHLVSKLPGG